MKDLGAQLRGLRERTGMSQADLAEKIHKSRVTVNKYENAETPPPVEILVRMCEILGAATFVIGGQRIVIELDAAARKPQAVPKQLRLKLGIICATDRTMRFVSSTRKGNRLDVEVLSA